MGSPLYDAVPQLYDNGRCPDCGLPRWDAEYLTPGEEVCTCDEPDDDAGHGGDWPPIETIDTGGWL